MSVVGDQEFIALQLSHNAEENSLRVSLVVRVDIKLEAAAPAAHVLTCVTQRVDHLFPGNDPSDLGYTGFRGFTVCDPGGLLPLVGGEGLEIIIEGQTESCGSIRRILSDKVGGEEDE